MIGDVSAVEVQRFEVGSRNQRSDAYPFKARGVQFGSSVGLGSELGC
jgi:hypothetical protein